MALEIISSILLAKNKVCMEYPENLAKDPSRFGAGMLSDALHLGFSYVESEDHYVEYILCNHVVMKKVIIDIPDVELTADMTYPTHFGKLWTAALLVTNKIKNNTIIFANTDLSVVLNLNLDNILKGV